MPNRPSQPSSRPGAPAKAPRHDPERLAKALRDNLLKRKSQTRARIENGDPPDSTK